MNKRHLVAVSLLLGALWVFLFWEKTPGVSYPVFVFLCLTAGFALLRSGNHHPPRVNFLIFGVIVLFSSLTFFRKEVFTRFWDFVVSFISILLLAGTYRSGAWKKFSFLDYISEFFHFLGRLVVLPWKIFFSQMNNPGEVKSARESSVFWKMLRGLLLSIPILVVFMILLAAADLIFAQSLENLLRYFNIHDLLELFLKGLLILLFTWFYTGLITYAEMYSQRSRGDGREKPVISPILGFTEGATILFSVIVLYSVFVIIQIRYFFSGAINITSYGFTFSEYARRGFAELVVVAIFSLLLIQGIRFVINFTTAQQRKIFTALVAMLVFLVLVILASSFQRLLLYESAFGFSGLRTVAHVFIIWLGILLISVMVLEFMQKPGLFANAVLAASVGFVLSLNIINVDSFIVRQNLKRAHQGLDLDVQYLASLSNDAVPGMVAEYLTGDYSPEIQRALGAALACHNQRLRALENDPHANSWQSFHFSDWVAAEWMLKIDDELAAFPLIKDSYRVFGSEGIEVFCPGFVFSD